MVISVGGYVEIDSQNRDPWIASLDGTYAIITDGVAPFPRLYLVKRDGGNLLLVHAFGSDLSLYNEGYNAKAGFFGLSRIDATRAFLVFGGRNSSTNDVKYISKVVTHNGSSISLGANATWFEATGTGHILSYGWSTAMSTPAGDVDTGAIVYTNTSTSRTRARNASFSGTSVSYGTDTEVIAGGRDHTFVRPFNNTGDLCAVWENGGNLYAARMDISTWSVTEQFIHGTSLAPRCDHLANGSVAVGWVDESWNRLSSVATWDGSSLSVSTPVVLGDELASLANDSPTRRWGGDAFHGAADYNSTDVSANGYQGYDYWGWVGQDAGERFIQFAAGGHFDFGELDNSTGIIVFDDQDFFGQIGGTYAALLSRDSSSVLSTVRRTSTIFAGR